MNTDKHAHEFCPNCKTIQYTYNDTHHAEVYCDKCGLVIRDSSINSITETIRYEKYKERQLWSLHHKRVRPRRG